MSSDLTAYLDWHVTIDENEAWCAQPGCRACPGDSSTGIGSVYGLTARNLCKAVAAHDQRPQADGQDCQAAHCPPSATQDCDWPRCAGEQP